MAEELYLANLTTFEMSLGLNSGDTAFCLKQNCSPRWEDDFSDMFVFSRLKALFTNFRTIQRHKLFSPGNLSCSASSAPTSLDLGIAAISCLQSSAPGLSAADTERTLTTANQPRAHRSPQNINSICTAPSSLFLSHLTGEGEHPLLSSKLKSWSTVSYDYWVVASTISWTLIWSTELFEFGVLCYPPSL